MWIFIRVCIAIAAFVTKLGRSRTTPSTERSFGGRGYFQFESKAWMGMVTKTITGAGVKPGIEFTLKYEGPQDAFFKALGFSVELQTGDRSFDRSVYIACDHQPFVESLQKDRRLRKSVLRLLVHCDVIRGDGANVFVVTSGDACPPDHVMKELFHLADGVEAAAKAGARRGFKDATALKAFLIESALYSIVGYAAGTGVESRFNRTDVYVDGWSLVPAGIAISIAVGIALVTWIRWFVGRSSRTHFIIKESALMLLFALPIATVQGLADLNRAFDRSPSFIVEQVIEDTTYRRSSRGPNSYIVNLQPPETDDEETSLRLPAAVRVTREIHAEAHHGDRLRAVIGRGRFGFPWYRDITVVEAD